MCTFLYFLVENNILYIYYFKEIDKYNNEKFLGMSSPQIVDGKKLEDQALNPKGHAPIKPWTHCYTKTRYLLRLGRFKRTKYPFTAIFNCPNAF